MQPDGGTQNSLVGVDFHVIKESPLEDLDPLFLACCLLFNRLPIEATGLTWIMNTGEFADEAQRII